MKHLIKSVNPGSIAHQLGVTKGDLLLKINGRLVKDVLDYRFFTQNESLRLRILKPTGEIWDLDIQKDALEDLGLVFNRGLMSRPLRCRNHCIFCFIDQMPPDLRRTLYFKDDDPRLSFLTGNYCTFTNLAYSEAKRIARYHLSPLHISVHTTDPRLRKRMMGNPAAGKLPRFLRLFNKAGITLHFQVVLCKGINDGIQLDHTLKTLLKYKPGAASLSVVPAGLTAHRTGLFPIKPFTPEDAAAVIRQVRRWQKYCRKHYGSAFVYCADEFYVKANLKPPAYKQYEDFPQLENGVGMMALFRHGFLQTLKKSPAATTGIPPHPMGVQIGIATGQAAGKFLKGLIERVSEKYPLGHIRVYEIKNNFFGPEITVSGLLTGQDIVDQLSEVLKSDGISTLFIPQNALRAQTRMMLDDMTLDELQSALGGVEIIAGNPDGSVFCKQLIQCLYHPL